MLTRRRALGVLAIGLTGCGSARQGLQRDVRAPADPRPLIPEIVSLDVTPGSTGVVIRATGIAPVQGYWDGALVPIPDPDPRRLSYAFRAAEPPRPNPVSTPRSREVSVALALGNRDLAGIREIRVTAARNSQSLQR